jgi:hypothetical protein
MYRSFKQDLRHLLWQFNTVRLSFMKLIQSPLPGHFSQTTNQTVAKEKAHQLLSVQLGFTFKNCIYTFGKALRTNSDNFPTWHWLVGFYNQSVVQTESLNIIHIHVHVERPNIRFPGSSARSKKSQHHGSWHQSVEIICISILDRLNHKIWQGVHVYYCSEWYVHITIYQNQIIK